MSIVRCIECGVQMEFKDVSTWGCPNCGWTFGAPVDEHDVSQPNVDKGVTYKPFAPGDRVRFKGGLDATPCMKDHRTVFVVARTTDMGMSIVLVDLPMVEYKRAALERAPASVITDGGHVELMEWDVVRLKAVEEMGSMYMMSGDWSLVELGLLEPDIETPTTADARAMIRLTTWADQNVFHGNGHLNLGFAVLINKES